MLRPALLVAIVLGLSACAGGMSGVVPDRAPDYHSARQENPLEMPPNLVALTGKDALTIPAAQAGTAPERHFEAARDAQGFLQVLPPLPGVQVVREAGQTPKLHIAAPPEKVWALLSEYFRSHSIAIDQQNPQLGTLQTVWLLDKSKLPQTGLSGLVAQLLGNNAPASARDRYRLQLSRAGAATEVTVYYEQSLEKALGTAKNPEGFRWVLSDKPDPARQLEMTRRLALFIAEHLGVQTPAQVETSSPQARIAVPLSYTQTFRKVRAALPRAGFQILAQSAYQGRLRVQAEGKIWQVRVLANGKQTWVSLLDAQGKATHNAELWARLRAVL